MITEFDDILSKELTIKNIWSEKLLSTSCVL